MKLKEIIDLDNRTVGEFEKIQSLLKLDVLDKIKLIDNTITIMEQLNIDEEIIDSITADDIFDFFNYLNEPVDYDNYLNTFEFDGVVYGVTELKGARVINELYKKLLDNQDFISYCLAIIFQDKSKSIKENIDPILIEKKQEYIKTLKAKDYLYHVVKITNEIIDANINN